jgi:hypothetical protein
MTACEMVASRLSFSTQIFIDKLPEACRPEAWEVAAVDDRHEQFVETLHRCETVTAIRMVGIVDELSMTGDIAAGWCLIPGFDGAIFSLKWNDLTGFI